MYHYRVDLTLPDLTTELARMGVITTVESDASSSCPAPIVGVVGSTFPSTLLQLRMTGTSNCSRETLSGQVLLLR